MKRVLMVLLLLQAWAWASAHAAEPAQIAVVPSRMELVQLGPNEYRLQYRQDAAPVVTAAAPLAQSTPIAATLEPAPPPVTPPPPRIQIVNGNGVRGMGERVRRLLARQGIVGARVANLRRFNQRSTVIEYLAGEEDRAVAMQTALQGHARLQRTRALPGQLTVRLTLGRDHAQRAPDTALLAMSSGATHYNNKE